MKPFTLGWWIELYGICVALQMVAHKYGKNDERAQELTVWIHDRIITKYGE